MPEDVADLGTAVGDLAAQVGSAQTLLDEVQTSTSQARETLDDEIADVMEEAAVVVLPYRHIESSGVLATALGYGRPVVVADVGSLGDTVRELDAGVVVPPEDSEALAEACAHLLRHPTPIGTTDALSWERAAEAHEAVYAELVAERE